MVALYQDPRGDKIFDRSNPSSSVTDSNREEVAALYQKIEDQERMILERDTKISKLMQEMSTLQVG